MSILKGGRGVLLIAAGKGDGVIRLRPHVFQRHRRDLHGLGVALVAEITPEQCIHLFREPVTAAGLTHMVCENCGVEGPPNIDPADADAAFRALHEPPKPCKHDTADAISFPQPDRSWRTHYRCFHCGIWGPEGRDHDHALELYKAALGVERVYDRGRGDRYRAQDERERSERRLAEDGFLPGDRAGAS